MSRASNPADNEVIDRRQVMLDRIERSTELPMMVLAFVMIPLLVAPFFWDLSSRAEAVVLALDGFIWALFAADLAIKVVIAPQRLEYVRQHWLDVLIVLVPFFRPLRILRIILYGSRVYRGTFRLARTDFLVAYAIGLVLLVATAVTLVERRGDSELAYFSDALWWGVVTVTTVGYGDVVPETQIGRAFAYVLMIGGIGIFGAITANFASVLVRKDDPDSAILASLVEEVQSMREELTQLRERSADQE